MHLSETGAAHLILTPQQEKLLLVIDEINEEGIKEGVTLWPNGRVVYDLDPGLSKQAHNC